MKRIMILVIFLSVVIFGCAAQKEWGREKICEKQDGEYTGYPKDKAVELLAKGIKEGAKIAGQNLSEKDAMEFAKEIGRFLCSSAAPDIESATRLVLQNSFRTDDIKIIVNEVQKR